MKITEEDLYAFVARADTMKKITLAERWLKDNSFLMSRSTLDALINTLEMQYTYLFIEYLQTIEKKIQSLETLKSKYEDKVTDEGEHYIIAKESGEIVFIDA